MDEEEYMLQVSDARREYLANTYKYPAYAVAMDEINGCLYGARAVLDEVDKDVDNAYDALREDDPEDVGVYIQDCADEISDTINLLKEALKNIEDFKKDLVPYIREKTH